MMGTQQGLSWEYLGHLRDCEGSRLTSCRSGENRIMMTKVYIFLIFMVLILPSLGLTRYTLPPPSLSSEPRSHPENAVSQKVQMVWKWMQIP